MAATHKPRNLAYCVDCGKAIRPPAERCRTHAAAEARRVMNLLRQSGEFVIKGPPHQSAAARNAPIKATAFEPELAILELGVRLAFQLAAASDPAAQTVYLRLLRNTLVPVFQIDRQETLVRRAWPLTDNPFLVEVVESKEPRMGAIAGVAMGPHAREVQNRTGVLAGIAVPVTYKGSVHGILAMGSRQPELLTDDLFQALIHVGQLLTTSLASGRSDRREPRGERKTPGQRPISR